MAEHLTAARQLVTDRVTAAFTGPIYADAAHAISAYTNGTLNDAWRDGFVRHVMDVIVEAAMAAAPLIEAAARADERAKVAEEIEQTFAAWQRGEISRPKVERGEFVNDLDWCIAIAQAGHAVRMPGAAQEATEPPDAYPHKGAPIPDAQKTCGCVGKCPSIFKPCPVCAAEVTSVAVDNALATTYGPCGHVVPDGQEGEG